MPLAAGTKLGPYEVLAPLGAGGMGEVYKARDTRLNRDVALKILPEAFASDSQRRSRFETEAKAVASLNHPNIVAVFDIGENFMVSELVDGETLRDAKPAQRKALDIAAQIADGLAAAHAKGITHRDLKPENVMLTRDGRAKILDFGLAQRAPGSTDATLTAAGTVMGTAGYMSPEQVRGENVDARSDIFSFGALVYELLAGKRAFEGQTAVEAMNAVLKDDPPELPDAVPAGVRELVGACLEKDREQRFQSAKDLALALRALSNRVAVTTSESLPVQKSSPKKAPLWIAAATLLIGAVGGAKVALTTNEGVEPLRVTPLTFGPASKIRPAFSPDGQSVAYSQNYNGLTELAVQTLGLPHPVIIAKGDSLFSPRWTADGAKVCYVSTRDLWCVSSAGGTPQKVLENVGAFAIADKGGDAYFLRPVAGKLKLFVSSPFGSAPREHSHISLPEGFASGIDVSANGDQLLFSIPSGGWVIPLKAGGEMRRIESGQGSRALKLFPDSRHIVIQRRNDTSARSTQLLLADSRGPSRRLLHAGDGVIVSLDVSADGRRIAFSNGQPDWKLVEYSISGKRLREIGAGWQGVWSPTGDRIASGGGRTNGIMTMRADGSEAARIGTSPSGSARFSPDGTRVAIFEGEKRGIAITPSGGGRTVRIVTSDAMTGTFCWSPDGEWIWFNQNGQVRKILSQGGSAVTVKDGGLIACSPDGSVLYSTPTPHRAWYLMAPDGKTSKLEIGTRQYVGVIFGDGGRTLYGYRPNGRSIVALDARTGAERAEIKVELDPADVIASVALHPDGKRFLLTTGNLRYNISILEGFAQPETGWRSWFRHWRIPEAPPPETPGETP